MSVRGRPAGILLGLVLTVVALVAMLVVLTLIFFFQDLLVKREKLFDRIRLVFLAVTLVWLGWIAQAQLSVVNILTFTSALRTDFQWSYFLVDPLIFILWFAVAAALLFWGRGPFCGWLCPFGALQELTSRLAKLARVPQVTVPWWLHERLWPATFVSDATLVGVVKKLRRDGATESAFRQEAPKHRFLHLATHGFFLGGACDPSLPNTRAVSRVTAAAARPRAAAVPMNPLRISGLAFAGANLRARAAPDEDDGILTAEEVSARATVSMAVRSASMAPARTNGWFARTATGWPPSRARHVTMVRPCSGWSGATRPPTSSSSRRSSSHCLRWRWKAVPVWAGNDSSSSSAAAPRAVGTSSRRSRSSRRAPRAWASCYGPSRESG